MALRSVRRGQVPVSGASGRPFWWSAVLALAACEARFPPRLAFGEQLSDGVVAVRSVFSAFFLVVDDRLQERAEHPLAKLVVLGCREHVDCHGARLPRGRGR